MLIKVTRGIEGDVNKVKISSLKTKSPNLDVLNYIKGGKYPEAEVGKYIYSVRYRRCREIRQYVRNQLSVAYDVTW